MKEFYPEQKGLKIMFIAISIICLIQFVFIAWMAGRIEYNELHVFDLNKRILSIENKFQLDYETDRN